MTRVYSQDLSVGTEAARTPIKGLLTPSVNLARQVSVSDKRISLGRKDRASSLTPRAADWGGGSRRMTQSRAGQNERQNGRG